MAASETAAPVSGAQHASFVIERVFRAPPDKAVFLDGYDDAGGRERGTAILCSRFAAELEAA